MIKVGSKQTSRKTSQNDFPPEFLNYQYAEVKVEIDEKPSTNDD